MEGCEHYQKGSYRNRCRIATSQGVAVLSIPLVKGKHEGLGIREVRISYSEDWQRQHWRGILAGYRNAPYFDHYCWHFEGLFQSRYEFLFDWNWAILEKILKALKLEGKVKMAVSEGYVRGGEVQGDLLDLRGKITPKGDNDGDGVHYCQVFEEKTGFLGNLSILDMLFCCGPGSLEILSTMSAL